MSASNINEETGTKQACAACKHQRKKCSVETCMLYPYFPAEKSEDFNAVHKYYGVSNLIKHIKKLGVEERERSVESFVWAAMAWNQNPHTGPLGLYMDLAQENQRLKQEIQELKTATTSQGKTGNLGHESSVHGNYSQLLRVPVEDVINFNPMPLNHDQESGLYYGGEGGLEPNFGNVQQRYNQAGMDYQRGGLENQMEITGRGREVGYDPYCEGLWNLQK